jgi:hypothetical protein
MLRSLHRKSNVQFRGQSDAARAETRSHINTDTIGRKFLFFSNRAR